MALWFQSSIGITIKAMKLLLTFVVCTVLDYVHAVTFRAAMRDNMLDRDGAPPGQFVDTEYHWERHQSTCNHYLVPMGSFSVIAQRASIVCDTAVDSWDIRLTSWQIG